MEEGIRGSKACTHLVVLFPALLFILALDSYIRHAVNLCWLFELLVRSSVTSLVRTGYNSVGKWLTAVGWQLPLGAQRPGANNPTRVFCTRCCSSLPSCIMEYFISFPMDVLQTIARLLFHTRIMLIQMAAFSQCCVFFSGGVQNIVAKCGDLFLPVVAKCVGVINSSYCTFFQIWY